MSVTQSNTLLGDTVREAREAYRLSVRGLAGKASLSPAQVSRIERGLVERPSMDTLAAIGKALDRNPIPLWILAGHVPPEEAIELLRDMLHPDAEIFDEWGDANERSEALALINDPSPNPDRLGQLTAKVFKTFETEETLWQTYAQRLGHGAGGPEFSLVTDYLRAGQQSRRLLEVARHLPGSRLAKVVEYANDQFEAEFGRDFEGAIPRPGEEEKMAINLEADDEEPGEQPFSRALLEQEGFEGFITVAQLKAGRISDVPAAAGAYVVLRAGHSSEFLELNPGGRFKHQDPSVSLALLKAKWIDPSDTVYIGKGNDLRRRIKQFVEFGAGKPVGHWGGRYIWQLIDSDALVIAWIRAPEGLEARQVETELLNRFVKEFGTLPFANLTR